MELVFRDKKTKHITTVDKALEEEPWEASRILLDTLRHVFFSSVEHESTISEFLSALRFEAKHIRPAVSQFERPWKPTHVQEMAIRQACCGDPSTPIDHQIYSHGGLHGLVGLKVSASRSLVYQREFGEIKSRTCQQWLASNISYLFQAKENDWIKEFSQEQNVLETSQSRFAARFETIYLIISRSQ